MNGFRLFLINVIRFTLWVTLFWLPVLRKYLNQLLVLKKGEQLLILKKYFDKQ